MLSKHLESTDGADTVKGREVVAPEKDGEVDELDGQEEGGFESVQNEGYVEQRRGVRDEPDPYSGRAPKARLPDEAE